MTIAFIFFDERDGEWSVRYNGQDFSDLCGGHPDVPAEHREAFETAIKGAQILNIREAHK
jgi:hypothetical protein